MKALRWILVALPVALVIMLIRGAGPGHAVRIGSKTFTESVVLGEMLARLAESAGVQSRHVAQLGGTSILFEALVNGQIDAYVEYTGTIRQEILSGLATQQVDIDHELAQKGVSMSAPLGFNNTYAIGMLRAVAEELGVTRLSDLRLLPALRMGFSNEFMDRRDGWPAMRETYSLPQTDVRGIDHDLAYAALESRAIDVTDLYTTDAKILKYDLVLLEDDRSHFPRYDAVILYRTDLRSRAGSALAAMRRLEGALSQDRMIRLNAAVESGGLSEAAAAGLFLAERMNLSPSAAETSITGQIVKRSREHLAMVVISLSAAVVVSIPLGIWAFVRPVAGQAILAVVGIVQTIPSLALLVVLMKPLTALGEAVPLLARAGVSGIGEAPAIVALFLYSLLPVVRNTHAGLKGISTDLRESALAMGLPFIARLRLIDLPLAGRTIIAGIKTAAVLNIGFATLGAIIGAGGYGQPILTGIRLNDYSQILQGAGPAAGLALVAQLWFELLERAILPKGLRLKPT